MQPATIPGIFALRVQRLLSHVALFPLSWIIICILLFLRQYRIDGLREIRKAYRAISRQKVPVLICANHLTMIDSVIIHWALSGTLWYFFHFNRFAWNLPAVENFGSTFFRRLVTYFSKCILIDRKGEKSHFEKIISRVVWLLRRREACMIFPEGTRSRSGKIEVENVTYGIGQIVAQVPDCNVLCIYLRAHGQTGYGEVPEKGSRFYLRLELIKPVSAETGRRAHRDLALQVIGKIKQMEDEYFARPAPSGGKP
jgi:1-acyl-sn-glycerol-3-phosphate acyltransferase